MFLRWPYSINFTSGIVADTQVLLVGLNDVFSDGAGKSLRSKDAVPVERLLKDQLNEELKEKLFGSSSTTDVSTDIIEHNACGKLLFNAIVDIGDSADRNSAAVLKSALEERKDDAPFLSALDSLGSSSKVMAFINFLFSKDNGPYWEASNADESRPSTGAETSGATTITETSGLTSRVGTSISDAEGLVTTSDTKKAMNNQIAGMLVDLAPLRQRLICLMQRNRSNPK